MREFQFPTITIGQVTGKWQSELSSQNPPNDGIGTKAVDARSTVAVHPDVPLTFEINLTRSPGLIHSADVYKTIGLNEFDGFLLKKDIVRLAPTPPEEHKFLTSVIEQAAKWTRLRAFEVRNLEMGASEIAAIDKLKPLKVLESRESTFDPTALARAHFLQNAEHVWVSGFPVARYLKGSARLTDLSLDESFCTGESMMYLKDCPHLQKLSIVQAQLGDDAVAAIASLRQVTYEKIDCLGLTTNQVRVLLSNQNLRRLKIDAAVRRRAVEDGIVDPRLNQI
jgi:hypothetical protein